MISYSNNVVAFSFIWFYRSQIMCLITCAWFWSDWFFCFIFSSVSKFYLFIFVVVASFLNHKQWSPKFLALGNQGDLSIPGFGEKFIGVEAGGTLELHGEGSYPGLNSKAQSKDLAQSRQVSDTRYMYFRYMREKAD